MNKKKLITLISLVCLTLVGSLFVMLASNMLMDDLFNKGVALSNMTIFVSLPAISVAVMFILAILWFIRTYRHPNSIKRISRLYLILAMIFAFIGIIGSILGGLVTYGSFTTRNPFPGYLIIFMVVNILLLLAACFLYFYKVNRMEEDKERVQITFKYVMKTIGWVLFIGLTLNRLGMLLTSPVYIYTRNLYYTFPIYLYLLVPVFLGTIIVLFDLEILNKKKTFILGLVAIGLNVAFFVYTAIKGLGDTSFISSISQLYPIDRMISKPIEILIHFLAFLGVGIAIILISRKEKQK